MVSPEPRVNSVWCPRNPGDTSPAEPDFDQLLVDDDIDSLPNMPIGHAISNGVAVYKAIGTDTALQAAGANSQGACLQGP